ncbi:MAG: (d)CMP kinase [Acidiferrobacterales bacterium]
MAASLGAPVLALDGPSGSGKGTVGQRIAQALGWHFLDSGALYRAVGLVARQAAIATDDPVGLARLAQRMAIQFEPGPESTARVIVNGADVSEAIRTEEIGRLASQAAVLPAVRQALLDKQHALRRPPGLVADGRDMGTVVFPDARFKVFLTATPEARAQRRYNQLKDKGFDVSLARLAEEVRARDARDAEREASPLKPADDACVIDTSILTIDEVVERVLRLLRDRLED